MSLRLTLLCFALVLACSSPAHCGGLLTFKEMHYEAKQTKFDTQEAYVEYIEKCLSGQLTVAGKSIPTDPQTCTSLARCVTTFQEQILYYPNTLVMTLAMGKGLVGLNDDRLHHYCGLCLHKTHYREGSREMCRGLIGETRVSPGFYLGGCQNIIDTTAIMHHLNYLFSGEADRCPRHHWPSDWPDVSF